MSTRVAGGVDGESGEGVWPGEPWAKQHFEVSVKRATPPNKGCE